MIKKVRFFRVNSRWPSEMKRKARAGKLCQKEVATMQGLTKSERRRDVGGCAIKNCERRRKTRLPGERLRIPIETETGSYQASYAALPETVRMARIKARASWKSSCIEPEGVLNDQFPKCANIPLWRQSGAFRKRGFVAGTIGCCGRILAG
jgi:hypothetical protein